MAVGDVVIRDPRALRALAHPVRLEILERLGLDGPATATVIGAAVGISPSAASYHLRALARFGLVVDAGGGTGRNRPWQAAGTGFMFEPAEHVGPGAEAAVQLLSAQLIARGEQETLAFVAGESSLDPDWRSASHIANATLNLTADGGGRGRQADRRRPRAVPAEHAHRRPRGCRARAAAASPLPPRAAGARAVKQRTPLFGLLAANAISITGNRLTQLAIPWFVLQSTGSVAQTGLVGFFSLLPFVISSALGGVIVDRLGYRRASIVSDVASGVAVLGVPILYHTVGLPLAALLALVFAGALLDAPGQTAREAMLPELLERAEMTLERGTSLFDGVSRGANMLGAPLAGVLIAVVGADATCSCSTRRRSRCRRC